jgi:hypothetical protein
MSILRRGARRLALALVMTGLLAAMLPAASFATTVSISGVVAKNGNWAHYTTRCTTTTNRPLLTVTAWAGDNADDYFYLRNPSTGLAIGGYTESNPLRFPLHDSAQRQLGPLASGTCFWMNARKDGFIFASGTETWTGNLVY